MKTWVRKSLKVGVLSAGFLLVAGNTANAADAWNSLGNVGVGNGNQVKAQVQAPIDVCGNSVAALLAGAQAFCQGGSAANISESAMGDSWNSLGNVGVLNGNQIKLPIQVPIDACGNAVAALLGGATAFCQGGSAANIGDRTVHTEAAYITPRPEGYAPSTTEGWHGEGFDTMWNSLGNVGVLNGNQIYAPIQVPINICGNAIAIVGGATALCQGGAAANNGDVNVEHRGRHHESVGTSTEGARTEGLGAPEDLWTTAGNVGLLNGNQIKIPVQIPINICGNAIAILGGAQAGCQGGATANLGDVNVEHRGHRSHDGGDCQDGNGHDSTAHQAKHDADSKNGGAMSALSGLGGLL